MANKIFNQVQMKRPNKNAFDLTHDVKMSGKMGWLMPTLALDCIPGDKISIGADMLLRFAPLIAPVMHRVDVSMHYFFVPNRLVWDGWESFIVNDTENPRVIPQMMIDGTLDVEFRRFLDYMGCPPPLFGAEPTPISVIPFAAYNKIYNDYYRDQNLIPEVPDQCLDGNTNNVANFLNMHKRSFEHDYFTSALPFAQKGAAVDLPLGNVLLKDDWLDPAVGQPHFVDASGDPMDGVRSVESIGDSVSGAPLIAVGGEYPYAYNPNGSLEVQPTTINDLRRAFKLQEWLEKNARGGTRYTESIYSHFGVKSPDSRLQRAEYITGVKSPVVISEVLNTTGTEDAPQGDMAGHGVAVMNGKSGSYFVQEHGYIIGIMSVMPKTAYQQGIPKHLIKEDFMEWFWPSFAHLGEQEVQNQEIYAYDAANGGPKGLFGYQSRYAEYKQMPSRVAGDYRTTLSMWHLGRIFDSAPTLSKEFLELDPDLPTWKRIFAVQDETDNLWMHILHKIRAFRPMPIYGTPSI